LKGTDNVEFNAVM